MTDWGRKMFVTPGVVVDGKLVTNDLVDINLGIRILLGQLLLRGLGRPAEMFVTHDPLGNPVDRRHPWNQHTIPKPAEARLRRQVQLDDVAALVRRHRPPGPRHRRRPDRPAVVDRAVRPGRHRLRQGHRQQRGRSTCRGRPLKPEVSFEWKIPQWSNALERNRARTYFQAYAAAAALHFVEKALAEVRAGHTKTWDDVQGARRGDQRRLHRGGPRRAVATTW